MMAARLVHIVMFKRYVLQVNFTKFENVLYLDHESVKFCPCSQKIKKGAPLWSFIKEPTSWDDAGGALYF